MNNAENQVVRVWASVQLGATDEGGRDTPIANKYMPRLKVNGIDGYAGFVLGESSTMAPGTSGVVELAAVGSTAFITELRAGQHFSIHEGSKQVGSGVIDSVIKPPI